MTSNKTLSSQYAALAALNDHLGSPNRALSSRHHRRVSHGTWPDSSSLKAHLHLQNICFHPFEPSHLANISQRKSPMPWTTRIQRHALRAPLYVNMLRQGMLQYRSNASKVRPYAYFCFCLVIRYYRALSCSHCFRLPSAFDVRLLALSEEL